MAHRYNEAALAFQEGFRTYPDRAFILNEAAALLDGGRYVEAESRLRALSVRARCAYAPTKPRAAQERARTHIRGRRSAAVVRSGFIGVRRPAGTRKALDAFDQAYEKSPTPEFLHNQATCLEKLGRPYAAADRYEAYLAAKPDAKDAAEVRSKVEQLRKNADTKPITATGTCRWPGVDVARQSTAVSHHRYDEAVAAYEEGFRTYPTNAFVLNKASALLDGGRYAEADLEYGRYLSDSERAARRRSARGAGTRARPPGRPRGDRDRLSRNQRTCSTREPSSTRQANMATRCRRSIARTR